LGFSWRVIQSEGERSFRPRLAYDANGRLALHAVWRNGRPRIETHWI
jgi:hypothetical protein